MRHDLHSEQAVNHPESTVLLDYSESDHPENVNTLDDSECEQPYKTRHDDESIDASVNESENEACIVSERATDTAHLTPDHADKEQIRTRHEQSASTIGQVKSENKSQRAHLVTIKDIRRQISSIPNDERLLLRSIFPHMTKYEPQSVSPGVCAMDSQPVVPILSVSSYTQSTKRSVIEFLASRINYATNFGYYENLVWGTVTAMLHTRKLLMSFTCDDVKRTYRTTQNGNANEQERNLIHSVLLFTIIKDIVDGNTPLFLSLCVLYYPLNLICVFESDVLAMLDRKNDATICIGKDMMSVLV